LNGRTAQQKDARLEDLNAILTPGMLVRHPSYPDWGVGQVQSNIGGKVTVNFRSEGKIVVDNFRVMLTPVFDEGSSLANR
tara:strand:+ start:393 stop:632 length:240 start_codon:yes stop_codon:yes gene_type:complete